MRGLVFALLLVAAIGAAPSTAEAQLVDDTDPCFVVFFGKDAKNILSTGRPGTRAHLEEGAQYIRTTASNLLTYVREVVRDGSPLTPAQLEGLRARNRCLPWLERQLGLIVSELKRMGASDIALPETRRRVPLEAFIDEVADALKEAEQLLAQILKVR